jgi:UDP-N-acetylmuramoylalanine-D-glutamate ligase
MKDTARFVHQRACVLGGGVSGIAAGTAAGAAWRVRDTAGRGPRRAQLTQAREALAGSGVLLRGGVGETLPDEPFTLCIASPSFAPEHPWLRACAERGIPVAGEMELGYAFCVANCWR